MGHEPDGPLRASPPWYPGVAGRFLCGRLRASAISAATLPIPRWVDRWSWRSTGRWDAVTTGEKPRDASGPSDAAMAADVVWMRGLDEKDHGSPRETTTCPTDISEPPAACRSIRSR